MEKLTALAIDLYERNYGSYSKDKMNDALRQEFIKLLGTDKIDYRMMRKWKPEVFTLIEESLAVLIGKTIQAQMSPFAEYRNLAWGDQNVFNLTNDHLFKVAVVADGTGNLRRQRLFNGQLTVTTKVRGVKIYEEFYRFLAGKVDWAYLVNKVAQSYTNQIYTEVYTAIYDYYSSLSSTYGITGAFNATTLDTLIEHVESANNASAVIYGTRSALSRITNGKESESMKDAYNTQGFYGVYNGTPMVRIQNVHTNGTETFAINQNFLLVIPQGDERLVKIVDEGTAIIQEVNGGQNADFSLEYLFTQKTGIALVTAAKFGFYKLL